MSHLLRIRFSLATTMMFVLTAAAASALYVKVLQRTTILVGSTWKLDAPTLFLLAIILTAIALAPWKAHSAVQTMLQVTLACLGCLTLIWIGEAHYERAIRYWFQASFAVMVTLPLFARRLVKSTMPRGPRRAWWKKTCEAVFFSFLNIMLVTAGAVFQTVLIAYGTDFFAATAP